MRPSAKGIEFRIGATVTEVVGRDGAVSGVRTVEQAPTGAVEGGRAVWAPVPGSEAILDADAILVAIGEEPDPSILPEGPASRRAPGPASRPTHGRWPPGAAASSPAATS